MNLPIAFSLNLMFQVRGQACIVMEDCILWKLYIWLLMDLCLLSRCLCHIWMFLYFENDVH